MQSRPAFKLLSTFLTFSSLLNQGLGADCAGDSPTVNQREVGFGEPPKFMVEVQNKCPMCPIINLHLNCGSFPQRLVTPRLLKVIAFDDCVLNAGLPLPPCKPFPSTTLITCFSCIQQTGLFSASDTLLAAVYTTRVHSSLVVPVLYMFALCLFHTTF